MVERRMVDSLEEYLKQLEIEKSWFEKYTLIETGKLPSESINMNLLPQISAKVQQYGFVIKFSNMVSALDTTNVHLVRAHELWREIVNPEPNPFNQWIFNYSNCLNSYIIHDIKHFMDDMIAVCWVLKQPDYVKNSDIDCIGTYMGKYNNGDHSYNDFDSFIDFFRLVNDVENAYKHHIPNNMDMICGKDEACIYAFHAPQNKNFLNPTPIGIALRELVRKFNEFYKYAFEVIAKYA